VIAEPVHPGRQVADSALPIGEVKDPPGIARDQVEAIMEIGLRSGELTMLQRAGVPRQEVTD
jgi:hypothetical protein